MSCRAVPDHCFRCIRSDGHSLAGIACCRIRDTGSSEPSEKSLSPEPILRCGQCHIARTSIRADLMTSQQHPANKTNQRTQKVTAVPRRKQPALKPIHFAPSTYLRTNCQASSAPYAVTATQPCDCRWVSQSRCSGCNRPPVAFSSMARPTC